MATEQQKSPKHRHISRRRLATAVIALLLLVSAALFWVLNAQGVIRGSWSSVLAIAFTVLGVIFTFLQWILPFPSGTPEATIAFQEREPGKKILKPSDEGKYADILEILGPDLYMFQCVFCEGKGAAPKTVGEMTKRVYSWYNKKCPICDAKGVIKVRCADIPIKDLHCYGTGHEPGTGFNPGTFTRPPPPLKRCSSCNGLGVRSLTGKVKVIK